MAKVIRDGKNFTFFWKKSCQCAVSYKPINKTFKGYNGQEKKRYSTTLTSRFRIIGFALLGLKLKWYEDQAGRFKVSRLTAGAHIAIQRVVKKNDKFEIIFPQYKIDNFSMFRRTLTHRKTVWRKTSFIHQIETYCHFDTKNWVIGFPKC